MRTTPGIDIPSRMNRGPSFDGGSLSYSLSASPASATYDNFLSVQQTAGLETSRHPSPDGSNFGSSFSPSPSSPHFNQYPQMQISQPSAFSQYAAISLPGQALSTPQGFTVPCSHLAPASPCLPPLPTPPEYDRDPFSYSQSPEQFAPTLSETGYNTTSIHFDLNPKKLYQTSERRRTQNRNAQKNFRQRQVNHTKTLEDQVAKLTKQRQYLKAAYVSLEARHKKAMRTIELLMAQHDAEGEVEDGQQQPAKTDNGDIMRKLINEILHDEVADSTDEAGEAEELAKTKKEESED